MKVHQLLDHYGITENPFAQEDAASDQVFRDHCLNGTHHPAWDKIYGDPSSPATSVVFGEQGSGKTALRLQIVSKLQKYNQAHPQDRAFIVQYEDFNPFLDSFRDRLSSRQRKPDRALQNWRLWDHMDSILTLAVTRLADTLRNDGKDTKDPTHNISLESQAQLTRPQKRDIQMLAAFYDQNRDVSLPHRWANLRRKLKYSTIMASWDIGIGVVGTIATIALTIWLGESVKALFQYWWIWLVVLAFWAPFLWRQLKCWWTAWGVQRQVRVIDHDIGSLRKILSQFQQAEIVGQPFPGRARGDDRYELLTRLQGALKTLGFTSIVVLIDRVDEPHLVHGSPERIKDLVWPLFDNKFLKQPGMAFKLLLPSTVVPYLNRQEKDFYERSRLDKQNMILSLSWTGQGLYDVANDRIRACAKLSEKPISVKDLFDPSINEQELIGVFDRLRAPRHLFKFLYRLFIDHCSKYTEDSPTWKIQRDTLQSTLAVFMRDLDAYDQKLGTG
ncbi:MFS transporter [Planctomicrobium piriforme]|uniref:KAP family P-loop domain-containing protein n=1 Tax=Planctomicrobium piriforme TaxID=1576369 RepID=A0A1I3B7G1_9PLAN|nr:hypothetical protein [Planctomicrobium piriforme]SFH57909.1 hypothetical protein SAMN05421753_101268 [Planctomicrobium piriforme]